MESHSNHNKNSQIGENDDELLSNENNLISIETNKKEQNKISQNIDNNNNTTKTTTRTNNKKSKNSVSKSVPNKEIKITSINTRFILGYKLKLYKIEKRILKKAYKIYPNKIVFHFKEYETDIKIFKNGKIYCTGAKTLFNSKQTIEKFLEMLNIDKKVEYINIKITKLSAICNINFRIDLEKLNYLLKIGKGHSYEPEFLEGIIVRMNDLQRVRIMETGIIEFIGFKSVSDMNDTLKNMYHFLLDCVSK